MLLRTWAVEATLTEFAGSLSAKRLRFTEDWGGIGLEDSGDEAVSTWR
jgi:hypothetical protein